MSTKRTRIASAAEPPSSSPKKRATVESSETRTIGTRGKRKLVAIDEEVVEKPKKSPKKATLIEAAVTRRSSKKIAMDEAVDAIVPTKDLKKERVKATKTDSAPAQKLAGYE